MSRENVEIVRSMYEGWAQGDFSAGDAFHPDVEFEMVDWPEGSNSRGLEAMRRAWMASLRAWDGFRAEAGEIIDARENTVVVLTRVHARGKGSRLDVDADTATVWTLEAGKITHLALYWNVAKARKVAGLPD